MPDSLRTAVTVSDPARALRDVVIGLRAAGHSRTEVSAWLSGLLQTVRRAASDSAAEEAILATLDAVEGWCHPSARLFPAPSA
jgi:hypothetical protein